ncbi:hypothetical protein ACLIL3_002965 [Acinetobacter radioresistens]|uniref:hypothetical protein n=1 Tax=Acinetobacter radioresistens TaxID=40216 RepID=UPI0039855AC4
MNLIEQLGGYERAKHEFEIIKEMQPLCPDEVKNNERMLLEYRRANNIFEVGDKVVLKNSFQDNVLTVQEFKDGFIRAFLGDSTKYSFGHAANFRHAEPEEVKAGKRLEVV